MAGSPGLPTGTGPGAPANRPQQPPTPAQAGYGWDPVQRSFTPVVGSPANSLQLQNTFLGALSGLQGAGPGGSNSAPQPPVSYGGGTQVQSTPEVPNIQFPSAAVSAANAADFGQAKDQAGQIGQAAMNGLQGALQGRGMGGGGYEAGQVGRIVTNAANQEGAASRAEATQTANEQLQEATQNYQGQIAQRSQNLQQQQANAEMQVQQANTAFSGGIEQRGQNIQQQQGQGELGIQKQQLKQQQILAILNGLSRQY